MDVLGPLPEAPGKVKFVIVAIDYFTKWIEAKPLAKTTGKEVKNTLSDNIVCRFGLLRIIVTDNETNFVNDPFKSWCKKLNIMQINTAVTHPQDNGLVERENRSLMEGIKTRHPSRNWYARDQTMMIKEGSGNEEEMRLNLDLLQEIRKVTAIHEARYKMNMEHYYNKRVRPVSLGLQTMDDKELARTWHAMNLRRGYS
uniref:Integrase catalytic domain-containing protein n=1 Tax=Tanacetum cinerariifolium TaxID=118510 RepID=A0A699GXB2_TANCI|nr:hypothetical protein [Tanacetum cinerariifolium]